MYWKTKNSNNNKYLLTYSTIRVTRGSNLISSKYYVEAHHALDDDAEDDLQEGDRDGADDSRITQIN